jgi:hypothetical protein
MRALFDNGSFIHDHDQIRFLHGAELMSDQNGRAAFHQLVEGLLPQYSDSASKADVASSSSKIGAFLSNARAMAIRCL